VPAMEFPIYAGIFKFRNARFLLYQKQWLCLQWKEFIWCLHRRQE